MDEKHEVIVGIIPNTNLLEICILGKYKNCSELDLSFFNSVITAFYDRSSFCYNNSK